MWKCKECGNIKFVAHLDSSVSRGRILKNKKFIADENIVFGFECSNCNCYHEDIEELADWEEDD